MLSRVAENLYWISRYVERTDNVIRLLADAFQMELETGSTWVDGPRPLDKVLRILSIEDKSVVVDGVASVEKIEETLRELTFDRKNDFSIISMLAKARENARGVQESLSTEAWSQINQLYLYVSSPRAADRFNTGAYRYFQRLKKDVAYFQAIIETTLPRTESYHFLCLGRYLERVDMLSRIISVHASVLKQSKMTGPWLLPWTNLLRVYSANEAYMRHSGERIDPPGVIRYLLLEEDFPRSMRFALSRCLKSLHAVADSSVGYSSQAERHLGRMESDLRYIDIDEILSKGIEEFLQTMQTASASVGAEIHQAYFRT